MVTVFHHLWVNQPNIIFELIRRGLLRLPFMKELLLSNIDSKESHEDTNFRKYERLMRHDAYRRIHGALHQVRWQ